MLFQFPTKIGVRLGRNSFDRFTFDSDKLAYLDTRSPYTKLEYIQGSVGEGIFEGEFSRNIRPGWNAGIAYRRYSANKQIGAASRRDGQVDDNGVKIYTHFQTSNNRYHLFANYLHMNQKFVETGGVRPNTGDGPDDLFDFLTENVNLTQAVGRDARHSIHIGQTYALFGEHLKLFHNLDERKQTNRFTDERLAYSQETIDSVLVSTLRFYPNKTNYDPNRTNDKSVYSELENTAGITGIQKHYYYRAYLKHRYARVTHLTPEKQTFNQVFTGGEGELKFNEKIKGAFEGEYKIADEYRTQATINFLFLGASQSRISYSPSLMERAYFGNHHNWENNFENTTGDRTAVWLQGKLWKNSLRLEVATNALRNYIVYSQDQTPKQISTTQRLNTVTADHKLGIGKFHWNNLVVYSQTTNSPYIRVPDWLIQSTAYFEGFIFRKALYGQIGVTGTYRSAYYGDAYMPALQQFYLQDGFLLEAYPVVDVFITADIKSLNVFLKLAHANEGLNGPGYFTAPYYPGMRRSFIFGVKWMFYD